MERKIIKTFDGFAQEQTEDLLGGNMEFEIGKSARKRIKNAVFERVGYKKRKHFPMRLAACAAALAIVFTSFAVIGFDNVAAAFRNALTFIPGIGIEARENDTIFTMTPIRDLIKSGNQKATVLRANYAGGYLSAVILSEGKALWQSDIQFFVNGVAWDHDADKSPYSLAVGADSSMFFVSHKLPSPKTDDVYEFSLSGFKEKLSFSMKKSEDFDDVKQIGPTDLHNDISVTATANMFDGQLVVWCYPFKLDNALKDDVIGIGTSINIAYNEQMYVESDGKILYKSVGNGMSVHGRTLFDLPDNARDATLHIPYLSMLRNEKHSFNVEIPKDYTSVSSEKSVKTSLGTIKITGIERKTNEYEPDKDTVYIKFDFENLDENRRLYNFNYEIPGFAGCAWHSDPENGTLDFIEVSVAKDTRKISVKISDLYYYLTGEYVIPLEIQ